MGRASIHLEQPIKQTRTFRVQCVSILSHEFKQSTPSFQCSAIVDSSPGAADQADSNIPCPMCFYVGTVFTNLIRIFVVANVHLRTYASSGFCPRQMLVALLSPAKASAKVLAQAPSTTQKCPRVHVLAGLPNCSFFRLLRDTRRANAR